MTALTIKQRAKVNAALCMIHDSGLDADAVTQLAQSNMAIGHNARIAYEKALNTFVSDNVEIGHAMSKMIQLIEASSPATVAQYDQAISQYIATGDNAALVALAPTIAQDTIALAIHNGEMTEADVGSGGLEMALGFEPGPVLQQAVADAASAAKPDGASAIVGLNEPQEARDTSSQVSRVSGPGYVGRKASAAPIHRSGFAPDAPNGLTPSAAREAARAAESRGPSFSFQGPQEAV